MLLINLSNYLSKLGDFIKKTTYYTICGIIGIGSEYHYTALDSDAPLFIAFKADSQFFIFFSV